MGKIEEKVKKKAKRFKIQQALMLALYRATAMSTAALLPNAALLRIIDPGSVGKRNPAYRIQQALQRLQQKGLLAPGSTQLTKRGRAYADRLYATERVVLKKKQRWDSRWRIIIFDIWERRRKVRNQLRKMLIKTGFMKVQNSVWVYPYDCEDLLVFLRADLHLGKSVLYIIADEIENDAILREHFGLK